MARCLVRWATRTAPLLALACATTGVETSTPDSGDPESGPATASPSPVHATAAQQVDALADEFVAAYFDAFPESATLEGTPTAEHGRLSENTAAARARWEAREDETLRRLEALDTTGLGGTAGRLTYEFLRDYLEGARGFRACQTELWEVSPTWTGWQSTYTFLATVQPVGTPELREAALARWRAFPAWLDGEIATLREGLRQGYSAPRHNVESVIEQMEGLLGTEVAESPFFSPAARDTTPAFRTEYERLVRDEIYPAVARYRDFLRNEYLPAARQEIAVARNPGGAECYRAAVRYWSSLDMAPQEIHETGLRQMEQIQSEMRSIAERSFGTSDVPALLQQLRTDPRYTFDSREHILAYTRAAVRRAEAAVPRWFGLVPRAEVVVEPFPAFQERSAPGGVYNSASDDGSRPGTYIINTYEPENQSIAGYEATAFHETYPGHHLQISIAKERAGGHAVTRYFSTSGFTEGWALYSERLADEMGVYSGDLDRLGLLSNEALRAARLVVDAGMHALGWSRQQAIDYILANTTESASRAAAEVDRYIAVPGQATSYMLGSLEIMRLRELAERELGSAFRIQDFHDRILEDGAVSLPMLRRKIERWVAANRPG